GADEAVSVAFGDFFFQAEDGIRDFHVTGVQTCALPILCEALGMRLVDLVERAWADLAIALAEQEEGRRVRVLSASARRAAGFSASRHPLQAGAGSAVGPGASRRGEAVLQVA